MDMSRREFLGGALSLAAMSFTVAEVASAGAASLPVIHGDGVHDDTAGLQALIDGKPFICESGVACRVGGAGFRIEGGKFRLSSTVHIGEDVRVSIVNNHFTVTDDFDHSRPLIHVHGARVLENHFYSPDV